jgi:Tfp pilus assembly protein PilN
MRAVNLLPREAKRTRTRLTTPGQLAIVAPFVVGALLTAGFLLASSKVNDNKATLQDARDRLAALPAPKPTVQQDPQLALQRDQRITALSSALQGRLAWDRLLREISAVLPSDVWLTKLSAQAPRAVPAAPVPTTTATTSTTSTTTTPAPQVTPAQPMSLQGYTYSPAGVARFLARMAVIPELQEVKLIQTQQADQPGGSAYSFSIEATVKPGVTG